MSCTAGHSERRSELIKQIPTARERGMATSTQYSHKYTIRNRPLRTLSSQFWWHRSFTHAKTQARIQLAYLAYTKIVGARSFQKVTLMFKARCEATQCARGLAHNANMGNLVQSVADASARSPSTQSRPAPRTHTSNHITFLNLIGVAVASAASPFGAGTLGSGIEVVDGIVRKWTKWNPIDIGAVSCYTEETSAQCRRVIRSFGAVFVSLCFEIPSRTHSRAPRVRDLAVGPVLDTKCCIRGCVGRSCHAHSRHIKARPLSGRQDGASRRP